MDSDMQGQWYESPALRGSPADVRYARNAPEMLEGLWIRVEHDFSTFQEYWWGLEEAGHRIPPSYPWCNNSASNNFIGSHEMSEQEQAVSERLNEALGEGIGRLQVSLFSAIAFDWASS